MRELNACLPRQKPGSPKRFTAIAFTSAARAFTRKSSSVSSLVQNALTNISSGAIFSGGDFFLSGFLCAKNLFARHFGLLQKLSRSQCKELYHASKIGVGNANLRKA